MQKLCYSKRKEVFISQDFLMVIEVVMIKYFQDLGEKGDIKKVLLCFLNKINIIDVLW